MSLLDSFDKTKIKCSACSTYVEIKESWSIFGKRTCRKCLSIFLKQNKNNDYYIPIRGKH
jgi:hypothetical protein